MDPLQTDSFGGLLAPIGLTHGILIEQIFRITISI